MASTRPVELLQNKAKRKSYATEERKKVSHCVCFENIPAYFLSGTLTIKDSIVFLSSIYSHRPQEYQGPDFVGFFPAIRYLLLLLL